MNQNQFFNHFSSQEMKYMRDLLTKFTEAIQPKLVLDPPESKVEPGKYNKEKRLFAGKIVEYKLRHPELSSKEVDWDEFNLLFSDNVFLKSTMLVLQALLQKMDNTRAIYDAEIYKSALVDYEHTRKNSDLGKKAHEKKFIELNQIASNIIE